MPSKYFRDCCTNTHIYSAIMLLKSRKRGAMYVYTFPSRLNFPHRCDFVICIFTRGLTNSTAYLSKAIPCEYTYWDITHYADGWLYTGMTILNPVLLHIIFITPHTHAPTHIHTIHEYLNFPLY